MDLKKGNCRSRSATLLRAQLCWIIVSRQRIHHHKWSWEADLMSEITLGMHSGHPNWRCTLRQW